MTDLNKLAKDVHQTAKIKGFYEPEIDERCEQCPHFHASKLMLMVSEIAEALEVIRHPESATESLDIELADAIIRIADYAGFAGIDLDSAIASKSSYNKTRPDKHGKVI